MCSTRLRRVQHEIPSICSWQLFLFNTSKQASVQAVNEITREPWASSMAVATEAERTSVTVWNESVEWTIWCSDYIVGQGNIDCIIDPHCHSFTGGGAWWDPASLKQMPTARFLGCCCLHPWFGTNKLITLLIKDDGGQNKCTKQKALQCLRFTTYCVLSSNPLELILLLFLPRVDKINESFRAELSLSLSKFGALYY